MDERERKKSYLERANYLEKDIQALKEAENKLEAESVDSEELHKLKEKIKIKKEEKIKMLHHIFNIIYSIEDDKLNTILVYKFFCGLSNDDIGMKLGFSNTEIGRRIRTALDKISLEE